MRTDNLKRINEYIYEISRDAKKGMRVPARIFATERLIEEMDNAVFDQICNVAFLPGIVDFAMCMPDGHSGYGFPIGGAAAIDPEAGVISPGGIGFDINCGVRLTVTDIHFDEIKPKLKRIVDRFFSEIPSGTGSGSLLGLNKKNFDEALVKGAGFAVKKGRATLSELDFIEEKGCVKNADPAAVSDRARERGLNQCGSLGSGNHYLEIQVVRDEDIFDKDAAAAFGIKGGGQIVYMVHSGSRGFGHQVATDYLKLFISVMRSKYGLDIPDRELACAPFESKEGQDYFKAMNCAINFAFLNRQLIDHAAGEIIASEIGRKNVRDSMRLVYDVCHNTAKLEKHKIKGKDKTLLIHRKGATRALPPGSRELPDVYTAAGQPVIIGGSMESGSYLLAGTEGSSRSFYTTAHGSGRTMSRNQAKRAYNGRDLLNSMSSKGIYVQTSSLKALSEEAGGAYKNLDEVAQACSGAEISKPVARMIPIGNVKA